MLGTRRIACGKANVPLILTQTLVVTRRIFVRHQANGDAKLCGECPREFDRHTTEGAIRSARHQNGIRGYQGGAKLALGGKPCSSVILSVPLFVPCSAVNETDECAQAYSGERNHLPRPVINPLPASRTSVVYTVFQVHRESREWCC